MLVSVDNEFFRNITLQFIVQNKIYWFVDEDTVQKDRIKAKGKLHGGHDENTIYWFLIIGS